MPGPRCRVVQGARNVSTDPSHVLAQPADFALQIPDLRVKHPAGLVSADAVRCAIEIAILAGDPDDARVIARLETAKQLQRVCRIAACLELLEQPRW
jgi:hypothetical protein